MKGTITCKVCNRDFVLMITEHYIAQDPQRVGVFVNLVSTDKATEFDAFDCPFCGCQNVVQSRKPIKDYECPCDYGICDECEQTLKEENDE